MDIFFSLAFFFGYLMIVLDYTSRGYQHPPKISGDVLSDNKGKFLKGVLSLSVFLSATASLGDTLWIGWLIAMSALVLPIILAITAI